MTVAVVVRPFREEDISMTKALFTDYHLSLPIDISYQNYQAEFSQLPGKYAPDQGGALLLAENPHGESLSSAAPSFLPGILGCVALRKVDEETSEMKRLFVHPAARGLRVGLALVQAIVAEAERLGYRQVLLDTLPSMTSAIGLYRHVGFDLIPKYYETPIEETLFFGKKLVDGSKKREARGG